MNIDITKLKNSVVKVIEVDEVANFNEEDIKKADILDLKDVKVTGQISKNNLDSYNVYLKVSGEMILPCAIDYQFIRKYLNVLYEKNYASKTICRHISSLRRLFDYLEKNKKI